MHPRSMLIALATAVVASAGPVAVAGQEEEPGPPRGAYSRGVAGQPPEVVSGTQTREPGGSVSIRGLELRDIPIRFGDERLSGTLTIASNGSGRVFAGGFAQLEPRTYRIDNAEGSWSGAGERILAIRRGQRRPLINHETMVLTGSGAYDGLVAYVFIDLEEAVPRLEAVILDVEIAPLPDPVTAPAARDVTGPRDPATDLIAGVVTSGSLRAPPDER